jgi:hypothetical protein
MTDNLQPWERQPGESEQAFRTFARYRDLGVGERSMPRLASDLVGETPDNSRKPESVQRQLERWSSAHHWQERCQAWDRGEDARHLEEQRDAVEGGRSGWQPLS